jgi:hypothetical protein
MNFFWNTYNSYKRNKLFLQQFILINTTYNTTIFSDKYKKQWSEKYWKRAHQNYTNNLKVNLFTFPLAIELSYGFNKK